MKEKEFKDKVNKCVDTIKEWMGDDEYNACKDGMNDELADLHDDVFHYAALCEHWFEINIREDYKRKTTFTSDMSIAEWYVRAEGVENSIIDTIKRCLVSWHDDIEFFAELILAVNYKSWEHFGRGNTQTSKLYAELYYFVKDLYFMWFDADNKDSDKAMTYYFDYVD